MRPPKFLAPIGGSLLLAAAIFVCPAKSFPQETQTTQKPPSAEETVLNELKRQKEIAELRRDIAAANKGAIDADLKPTSTAFKSDVAVTGEDIGPDIMVFKELRKSTGRIGETIRASLPANSTLVVFDSETFSDWAYYRRSFPLFKVVMEDLTRNYCVLASTEKEVRLNAAGAGTGFDIAAALARGASLTGQLADVLSYFRTETKISGKKIVVDEGSIVAELFGQLSRHQDLTLIYPKVFPSESPVFCDRTKSESPCCPPGDAACGTDRKAYCSEVANLFDDLYRARRAAFQAKPSSPEIQSLERYFQDFNKLFTERRPDAKQSALERYLSAESVDRLKTTPNTYFIEVNAVGAVGSQRVRKNLFILSDKLDYAGGLILRWTLYDSSGRIRNSGIDTTYDGYTKPKELRVRNQ